jgi:hypothetical protein
MIREYKLDPETFAKIAKAVGMLAIKIEDKHFINLPSGTMIRFVKEEKQEQQKMTRDEARLHASNYGLSVGIIGLLEKLGLLKYDNPQPKPELFEMHPTHKAVRGICRCGASTFTQWKASCPFENVVKPEPSKPSAEDIIRMCLEDAVDPSAKVRAVIRNLYQQGYRIIDGDVYEIVSKRKPSTAQEFLNIVGR